MLWTEFSLRHPQYFGTLSFSFTLTSTSVPAPEKKVPQHEAAISTLYFWDGTLQVMIRPGFL